MGKFKLSALLDASSGMVWELRNCMSETEDVNYSNMLLKLLAQLYIWGLAYVCACVCVCAVVKRSILSYHLVIHTVLPSCNPYCLTILSYP